LLAAATKFEEVKGGINEKYAAVNAVGQGQLATETRNKKGGCNSRGYGGSICRR